MKRPKNYRFQGLIKLPAIVTQGLMKFRRLWRCRKSTFSKKILNCKKFNEKVDLRHSSPLSPVAWRGLQFAHCHPVEWRGLQFAPLSPRRMTGSASPKARYCWFFYKTDPVMRRGDKKACDGVTKKLATGWQKNWRLKTKTTCRKLLQN